MKWFLRFLLWSALLALPCQFVADAYQRLLMGITAAVLGFGLQPGAHAGPDLSAANMLGVYAAMCLASTAAPWITRSRALVLGLAAVTALECATGLVSISAGLFQSEHGAWAGWVQKALDGLLSVPRFTSAPALWLLFLGRFKLPRAWLARIHLRRRHAPG